MRHFPHSEMGATSNNRVLSDFVLLASFYHDAMPVGRLANRHKYYFTITLLNQQDHFPPQSCALLYDDHFMSAQLAGIRMPIHKTVLLSIVATSDLLSLFSYHYCCL
jgi:hypothetical protein